MSDKANFMHVSQYAYKAVSWHSIRGRNPSYLDWTENVLLQDIIWLIRGSLEAEGTDSGGVYREQFQTPHHSIGAATSKSRKTMGLKTNMGQEARTAWRLPPSEGSHEAEAAVASGVGICPC